MSKIKWTIDCGKDDAIKNQVMALIGEKINGVKCERVRDVIRELKNFYEKNKSKFDDRELISTKKKGAASARLDKVTEMIKEYNEGKEHWEKLMLTKAVYRAFGMGAKSIEKYIEDNKKDLDKYHKDENITKENNVILYSRTGKYALITVGNKKIKQLYYDMIESKGLLSAFGLDD